MASKSDFFLQKTLGKDFFESLVKIELWKPKSRAVVDHEEIKTALQIVPRVVMEILIRELTPMAVDENKEIIIPIEENPPTLVVTKNEQDVYTGHIQHENKVVVDFKYRSLPGIGLVIMSAFELYDIERLTDHSAVPQENPDDIQKLIKDRLSLHDLVSRVVDNKMAQKDAIYQLFLEKMTKDVFEEKKPIKRSPIQDFVEKNKPLNKKPIVIQINKHEEINCPFCREAIFSNDVFSGCICVGDDRDKKVYLKKNERGLQVRFGKGWDPENIEMLLKVIRSKRG